MIAGISTLAAYTGGANQFHWIGWYNVAIGGALLCVQIALFHGECAWKKPEMKCTTTKCSSLKSNKTVALTGSVVITHNKLLIPLYNVSWHNIKRLALMAQNLVQQHLQCMSWSILTCNP